MANFTFFRSELATPLHSTLQSMPVYDEAKLSSVKVLTMSRERAHKDDSNNSHNQ